MPESSIFCGNCGTPNPSDALVCVKCGALLSAYQTGPAPIPAAEEPVAEVVPEETESSEPASEHPVEPEPIDLQHSDPGGATDAIFGEHEIAIKPIVVEPFEFDAKEPEPIPVPKAEAIEAEFRAKPQAATPPPKLTSARPIPVEVVPRDSAPGSGSPENQNMFGSRYPTGRVVVWQLGRKPRFLFIAALVLIFVACPLTIAGHGGLAALGFCLGIVAIFGLVGALIVWARRKATSLGQKRF